ncbi:MAG: DUF3857 and transglutaminase domain-containing protein [Flavobacteriaceae bacterium]|nr:DUF3857 and transglutaminase domain-containing protein [Flavobacteriaceae bacterium]
MKRINLFIFLFITTLTFSQSNFNSESLTVTRADLEINVFEKDSTANALFIYELGNSYIDKESFNLKTKITKKLKFLNRKGFEKATILLYLYNNKKLKERIKNIRATTYNLEDNNITKTSLEPTGIFREKYNDNLTIVKLTFPNIKEGSVVTYSYTIESPFIFKYKEWYFQDDIPKLHSEYKTSIPVNYEYNIKLVGLLPLDDEKKSIKHHCIESRFSSGDCAITTYIMKDIPAFIEEDYITTKDNYLARIEYELKVVRQFDGTTNKITKSWESADKELNSHKNIGKQLKRINTVKNVIPESIAQISDPLEKAQAIYTFVQKNYAWNKKNRTNSDDIKELIDRKSGSAFEINILLHNLLKYHKIEVTPILLSTRENGFVTKVYPVITDFNYIITKVIIDGKEYLLDGTDKHLAFGEIPFKCLNHYGRAIDFKNGSYWTDIKATKPSVIQQQITLKITAQDSIIGTVKSKFTGYHSLSKKRHYFDNNTEYVENLEDRNATVEINNHAIESNGRADEKFQETYGIKFIDNNVVADKTYLDPFLTKFFDKNPFNLQERTYPIDFGYKDAYLYSFKIDLGDAYEIIDAPENVSISLPDNKGQLIFTTKNSGNEFTLFFKINFKEAVYGPEYYSYIKAFMSKIVDIQNNTLIVLKKK